MNAGCSEAWTTIIIASLGNFAVLIFFFFFAIAASNAEEKMIFGYE